MELAQHRSPAADGVALRYVVLMALFAVTLVLLALFFHEGVADGLAHAQAATHAVVASARH